MVSMNTKNFTTLVQDWAAAAQASLSASGSKVILNFKKGSVLRALAESQGSSSLWMQGLILKLLTATRLATSKGNDVDTFCADYMPAAANGFTMPDGRTSPRLPANAATGLVTFSRAYPVNPAVVPVGALVQSGDGTQNFAVTADTTNSAYGIAVANGLPGYTIPAQVSSMDLPVQFQFPTGTVISTYTGPTGNVQAGGITILKTGISGVDGVLNANPFSNGFLAETDAALKARFVLFISSLAKGTEGAIGYAVQSVQQNMQYQIWEPGSNGFTTLTVYVDDGTGAIPTATLTAAQTAITAVKAAGVPIAILAATQLTANATMTIVTAAGYNHATVVAQVVAALKLYINGIGLGSSLLAGTLSYMKLAQIAFEANPGVIDVTGYSLNNTQADLVPTPGQVVKAGTIIVS